MVIDLPWQMILASLDESQTRDATFAALSKTLAESAGDRDASFASMMAPHIKSLKSVAAKELAFQLFRDYSDVPEVLEAALADVAHEQPGVRQAAARVVAQRLEDGRSVAALVALIGDPDPGVRNSVMGYLPDLAAATPEPGNGALHLLIDEARRDEADALLNRLEGAVNTLQDLGLDDAQHRIIDEVVRPLIVQLRETLAAEYQPNEIAPFRMQASASAGSLAGAAKSLAIASSAIADADDAAENVSAAAEGIWSIVQMLIP